MKYADLLEEAKKRLEEINRDEAIGEVISRLERVKRLVDMKGKGAKKATDRITQAELDLKDLLDKEVGEDLSELPRKKRLGYDY